MLHIESTAFSGANIINAIRGDLKIGKSQPQIIVNLYGKAYIYGYRQIMEGKAFKTLNLYKIK